ncbi:MAG: flagellar motor protein MotB [Pseudomonadota bacterium]
MAAGGKGQWKVAYADFVTAMMAFFLVLWLLASQSVDQLQAIADYFDPASVSSGDSGAGGLFGGLTIGAPGSSVSLSAKQESAAGVPAPPYSKPESSTIGTGVSEVEYYESRPGEEDASLAGSGEGGEGDSELTGTGNAVTDLQGDPDLTGGTGNDLYGDNSEPTEGQVEGGTSGMTVQGADESEQESTLAEIVAILGNQQVGTDTADPEAGLGPGQGEGQGAGQGGQGVGQGEEVIDNILQDPQAAEEVVTGIQNILQDPQAEQLRQSIQSVVSSDPSVDMQLLNEGMSIDTTPQGVRVQIIDQDQNPLFESGTSRLTAHAQQLLNIMSLTLTAFPNDIKITGHTDSVPFSSRRRDGYTNWELSTDRANSTRRALLSAGFPSDRIRIVSGVADREPLAIDDPDSPINRRMSIVLLRPES